MRVGDWVLTSRVHGTDPATGSVANGGIEAEARQALANIAHLVGSAEVVQLTGFVRDAATTAVLSRAAREDKRMPPLSVVTNFVPPSMNLMLEAIAGTPAVREIFTDAVMLDNLFFAPALNPTRGSDFKSQLRSALERMDATLAAAGLSRAAVAHVSVYLPTVDLKPLLNDVWSEWFPDPNDRPPHKYVPDRLPSDRHVELQVYAVRDAGRRVLEIPGLVHGDPMSIGTRMAGQVFSSRLFAAGEPESQARSVFAHAQTLLSAAGGSLGDISQINAFFKTERDRAAIQTAFDAAFGDMPPKLRLLNADLPGSSVVRIEVIGSI